MDELNQKITEILQDPTRMQHIMEVASSLGLSAQAGTATDNHINAETSQWLTDILQQAETKEKRQETLVRALLPYLKPKRQIRLERAMKISHLSRVAGVALQSNKNTIDLQEGKQDV